MGTTTFIYALCEPGTRTVRYIGKANDPEDRFISHVKGSVKQNNHLGYWLRSLRSRNEMPSLVVLREVLITDWQMAEERYIRLARGCGMSLVNATDGGDGLHNPSVETRAKMSEAGKRLIGDKNPFFGKKHTLEARAKQSASKKGKPLSPEGRASRIGRFTGEKNGMFGRTGGKSVWFGKRHTPKSLEKMSASQAGENHYNFGGTASPETRARMSNSQKLRRENESPEARLGKRTPITPEKRARLSADMTGDKNPMFGVPSPMLGKKHTSESRARMSEALKLSWATRKAAKT